MSEPPEDRRARKAIRREWEDAGRPLCPVCETEIEPGCSVRVSHLWRAVVHPFCCYARVTGQSESCPLHPNCPIPFPGRDHCACPRSSAVNMIILARRYGEPTVRVATFCSPGAQRAAREAGLNEHYQGVPLREIPRFDLLRKYGTLAPDIDESFWDQRRDLNEPPEYLTVDVDRTIREGRIIAAPPPG